jgi:hypothetical protein
LPPVPAVGPQPKARCQHCADLETTYGLEIHALQVELHAVRTIDEDLMKELSTDKQKATEQVRASHAEIRDLTDHIQALKADIASLRSTLAQKRGTGTGTSLQWILGKRVIFRFVSDSRRHYSAHTCDPGLRMHSARTAFLCGMSGGFGGSETAWAVRFPGELVPRPPAS